MIVTAWIIKDVKSPDGSWPSTLQTIERVIYNELGQTDAANFLNSICVRNPMARVEFGPVSVKGWGR